MTLRTLGMGIANVLTKAVKKTKKLGGDIKSGKFPPAPKTDIPFYTAVGTVVAGRQLYKKLKHGQTDWGAIKEAHKKSKEKKKKKDKE